MYQTLDYVIYIHLSVISQIYLFPFNRWGNKFPSAGERQKSCLWIVKFGMPQITLKIFYIHYVHARVMHMCEGMNTPQLACEHQRTACRACFSPSTMWFLRIEFRLSDLSTTTLFTEPLYWLGFVNLKEGRVIFEERISSVKMPEPHWSVAFTNRRWGRVHPISGSATPQHVVLGAIIK